MWIAQNCITSSPAVNRGINPDLTAQTDAVSGGQFTEESAERTDQVVVTFFLSVLLSLLFDSAGFWSVNFEQICPAQQVKACAIMLFFTFTFSSIKLDLFCLQCEISEMTSESNVIDRWNCCSVAVRKPQNNND